MTTEDIHPIIDHIDEKFRFLAREIELIVSKSLEYAPYRHVMLIWRHSGPLIKNRSIVNIYNYIVSPIIVQSVMHLVLLSRNSVLVSLLNGSLQEDAHVIDYRCILLIARIDSSLIKR